MKSMAAAKKININIGVSYRRRGSSVNSGGSRHGSA